MIVAITASSDKAKVDDTPILDSDQNDIVDSYEDSDGDGTSNHNDDDNSNGSTGGNNGCTVSNGSMLTAWNDLGMHCMDSKINTSRSDKIFPCSNLQPNVGLTGNQTTSTKPQPLTFNATHGWWEAEGIPLAPYNDDGSKNDYPLVKGIQGHAGTIGECTACHATVPNTVTGGPHGMPPSVKVGYDVTVISPSITAPNVPHAMVKSTAVAYSRKHSPHADSPPNGAPKTSPKNTKSATTTATTDWAEIDPRLRYTHNLC